MSDMRIGAMIGHAIEAAKDAAAKDMENFVRDSDAVADLAARLAKVEARIDALEAANPPAEDKCE